MIEARTLHGVPANIAECYGKPHIMARWTGSGMKAYEHMDGLCPLCHRSMVTNTHHQPDRHIFNLRTGMGIFVLRPALFGLCGSGTTGCHGLIEANLMKVEWVWDSDDYREQWWSGYTLSHSAENGIVPHSRLLYLQGCWRFTMDGHEVEVRDVIRH